MRHGKKFNHLGRKVGHRRALLKNLAKALIEHKRINTTLAKAKALRIFVEPIITKGKINTTHNRRLAFSHLQDKEVVTELFSTVADKVGDRPGGYTRIIKTGFRKGDGAEMAMIELVDFNEVYSSGSDLGEKKTRRGRRKKKSTDAVADTAGTAVAAEVVEDIVPEVVEGDFGSDPEMDILKAGNVEESGTVVIAENEDKLGVSEEE